MSEARRRLPALIRKVQADAGAAIEITVHGKVVAELRPALPEPAPGEAARRLREIMGDLPKRKKPRGRVSEDVKRHLYGGASRRR